MSLDWESQPEEDDDIRSVITDTDIQRLHRDVPAFRRKNLDTAPIKQHFYPEGGWGWIICGASFIAHMLTMGMELAFGLFYLETMKKIGKEEVLRIAWIGPFSLTVSKILTFVVHASSKEKSPRLVAIFGGIIMTLGCLFTSFALEFYHLMISYGLTLGIGISMVRETSNLMLGEYFKRRREFVEIIAQAGTGIGIALFSVLYKEVLGKLGWPKGLQVIAGILSITPFLGMLYRSALLYHPRRAAREHVKNVKKRLKKWKCPEETGNTIDISPFRLEAIQVLLLSSGLTACGIYTPVFYLGLLDDNERVVEQNTIWLEIFLGLSTTLGCVGCGLMVLRGNEQCLISLQYLCQGALFGITLSLLGLGTINGFHAYALVIWVYGFCLGGFIYLQKLFVIERVRPKQFTKVWASVQFVEGVFLLGGVVAAGYVNHSHPNGGYFISFLVTTLGAVLLSFVGYPPRNTKLLHSSSPTFSSNNSRTICNISPELFMNLKNTQRLSKKTLLQTFLNIPYLEEKQPENKRGFRSCKSMPEGLEMCKYNNESTPIESIQDIEMPMSELNYKTTPTKSIQERDTSTCL